jgi:prolyl 4-hydroxylase
MNLTDFIQVYDNVVSPATCKHIINEYNRHADCVEEHDTEGYKFHQLNLNHTDDLKQLANAYIGSLLPYYEDYFKRVNLREYVKLDGFEEVRIKKYLKGTDDQFKTHVDVVDKHAAVRYCIAILYLNENDGLTTFPNLGIAVKPEAGRVVIFPPMWMFPHNGLPSTTDDKYIMMTCLHYT